MFVEQSISFFINNEYDYLLKQFGHST